MPLETSTCARAFCFGACGKLPATALQVTQASRAGLRGCGRPRPGAASVRAWSLDVVDHQYFNLAFDCLQPEPKLFL